MAESNFKPMLQDVKNDLSDFSNASNPVADMASQAVDRVSDVASQAQRRVKEYLRDHDAKDMLEDLNSYVKSHPTQALIGAALFGFVTAAVLRRR
jgi:ElaB/YqjD/DUF883 family membrane-anchored ribosome-binding protein